MVALTVFKFTAGKKIVLENKENVRFFRFKENKIFHQSTDEEEKKKDFLPFLITVKQFSSNYYTQVM
jgi:hypothetical protein